MKDNRNKMASDKMSVDMTNSIENEDFIAQLLSGQDNRAYDLSPMSQKLLVQSSDVCKENSQYNISNTLVCDSEHTTVSRDASPQLLSVIETKRPSSVGSGSHLAINTNGYDVDDHMISVLSYGVYGALLLFLAVLTTIILLCFG